LGAEIGLEIVEIDNLLVRLNYAPLRPTGELNTNLGAAYLRREGRDISPIREDQLLELFARDRLPEVISLREKAVKIGIQTTVFDACIPQPTTIDNIRKIIAALTAMHRSCEVRTNEIRQ